VVTRERRLSSLENKDESLFCGISKEFEVVIPKDRKEKELWQRNFT
jgi:hypothetical protein